MNKVRINKILSDIGLGSRRGAEELIRSGRVHINGKKAELGDLIGVDDIVLLDGVDLPVRELVTEHLSLEKIVAKEKGKNTNTSKRNRSEERAESQRLQHASKSAALRKTSKNNPVNKERWKKQMAQDAVAETSPKHTISKATKTIKKTRP